MRKNIFLLCALCACAFAKIYNLPISKDGVEKFEQIIDVRTPSEWKDTGIIDGAITIDIFSGKEEFVNQVLKNIDPSKPVALVCRSGNRSSMAAKILNEKIDGLEIYNLDGGMGSLMYQGYKTKPYKK